MEHLAYISFFENAAKRHQEIAHDQPLPNNQQRKSFFRMNNEDEMQEGLMNDASFPALALQVYQGKLNAQDNLLVRDWIFGWFDIRDHVKSVGDYDEVETVRARCKRIGYEIIALMIQEKEREDTCSVFKSLDVNSFRYQFIGPVNTNEFGCAFAFTLKSNADAINQADLDSIFSL
jgi:hypothetical protein